MAWSMEECELRTVVAESQLLSYVVERFPCEATTLLLSLIILTLLTNNGFETLVSRSYRNKNFKEH
eukprot:4110714-Amphidinium_carterae.1